jgi:hypothetical protein
VTGRPLLDLSRIGGLLDGPLHRRVGAVVAPKGIVETLRKHGRPVLAALAVPHVDAVLVEIKLLDPEAEGL